MTESGPGPQPRVLVVDDDPSIRETLLRILEDSGYRAEGATDGAQALARLQGAPAELPALILMDLRMPRMSGRELRRALLDDPALASIPVLLLSAEGRRPAGLNDLQITEVLEKPVRLERLLATVERLLAHVRHG